MAPSKLQPPPGLNIILGDSAGGTFIQNYGRQDLLIDRDVLSVGPTARCADFAAWKAMRSEFWDESVSDDEPHPATLNIADDTERLRAADCINVWAATSVTEQLSIAFTLHAIDTLGIDPARLRLLQFEEYRDRPQRILGMGELIPAAMAAHPEPVPFTTLMLEDYRAAWSALTSPEPISIERFAEQRPNASRWLKQAMHLMLRRFPDRQTGLPHWDWVMLGMVSDKSRKAARIVGEVIGNHCWADGDLTGDLYLYWRFLQLGDESLPKPLIDLDGDTRHMGRTEATLTPFGREVLEGRASYYPANPIDDWAAGTHLSSRTGNLWFHDAGKLVRETGKP